MVEEVHGDVFLDLGELLGLALAGAVALGEARIKYGAQCLVEGHLIASLVVGTLAWSDLAFAALMGAPLILGHAIKSLFQDLEALTLVLLILALGGAAGRIGIGILAVA